jgi:hypothetical protein
VYSGISGAEWVTWRKKKIKIKVLRGLTITYLSEYKDIPQGDCPEWKISRLHLGPTWVALDVSVFIV